MERHETRRQIVLGMGAGQCGTLLLAQILDKQHDARVSHEQPPLLPWNRQPGAPGIRERLQRLLATHKTRLVGDVASFYLPYVEEAIAFDPYIRIVCLRRRTGADGRSGVPAEAASVSWPELPARQSIPGPRQVPGSRQRQLAGASRPRPGRGSAVGAGAGVLPPAHAAGFRGARPIVAGWGRDAPPAHAGSFGSTPRGRPAGTVR